MGSNITDLSKKNSSAYDFNVSDSATESIPPSAPMRKDSPAKIIPLNHSGKPLKIETAASESGGMACKLSPSKGPVSPAKLSAVTQGT